MRNRLVVAGALVALLLSACGKDTVGRPGNEGQKRPTQTYDSNAVTFDYPADWDEVEAEASATTTGSNELWNVTFGPDPTNVVNLTAYRLNIEVTEDNLDQIQGELESVISGVVADAKGEIVDGPTATTLAGFPAFTYEWNDVDVNGEPRDSDVYFLFDGTTEYFFNCQYSNESRSDIQEGCQIVLNTFRAEDTSV